MVQQEFNIIEWNFNNISPFALSAFLVFATNLSPITGYLFLASFLYWFGSVLTYGIWITYKRRWLQIIWEYVGTYAEWIWRHIVELKRLYIVKVVAGVLISYICAATGHWFYYHFDLVVFIKETLTFIANIPKYLQDSTLLIKAIHNWLNKMFLNYIVEMMTRIWNHSLKTIINNPIMGLAYIGGAVVGLIGLLIIARQIPTWYRSIMSSFEMGDPVDVQASRRPRRVD